MAAATGGRYESIVEDLVNHNADINIQDKNQVSTCEFSKMMHPTTILSCSDIIDASCTHWVHIQTRALLSACIVVITRVYE